MGRTKRRQIFLALGLLLFMGVAVHFRLWAIDYRVSSTDSDLLRKQFDLASREAMDESAEWRRRFDLEFDKVAKCSRELEEIKKSTGGKKEASAIVNQKMEMMQKENMDLLDRVESLKQELEAEKLKCSMPKM